MKFLEIMDGGKKYSIAMEHISAFDSGGPAYYSDDATVVYLTGGAVLKLSMPHDSFRDMLLTEVEDDISAERRARAKKNLTNAYRAKEQAVQVLENIENDIEAMKLDIAAGGYGSFGKR